MISVPEVMYEELKSEMKKRRLDSIEETIRQIISNYFRDRNSKPRAKIRPIEMEKSHSQYKLSG
jgi:hypothetical protein